MASKSSWSLPFGTGSGSERVRFASQMWIVMMIETASKEHSRHMLMDSSLLGALSVMDISGFFDRLW
jgi:hypothetical protein